MNKPLAAFGGFFAAFGGVMLMLDMLLPHTKEGTVSIPYVSGPVGWFIFAIGAAFFLLAVEPKATAAIFAGLPVIGKWFQEKPVAQAAPPVDSKPPEIPK